MPCRSIPALSLLFLFVAAGRTAAQDPPSLAKQSRWVTSVAFVGDGQIATGGGESLLYRAGDVKIWDGKSGALAASLEGQPTIVWSLTASADGKTFITSGYDGKIILWNVAEKKPQQTIEKKGWIRSVALSGDGKNFAAAMEDGNVILFETEGPKELKTFKAHEAAVYDVAFSPDGALLATCSTDKLAKLWDWKAEMPTEKAKLEGHGDAVWAVAWKNDGSLLATASADRKIKLWNAEAKEQGTLDGHKDWVSDVAFSPDGASLASASHDRTAKIWDLSSKRESVTFGPHASTCWCVAFSPDGAVLAVGTHNAGVRLWKFMKAELFPAPPEEKKAEGKQE